MITYRLETQPVPEPPVKFYKIIAISFLVITAGLLGLVIFVTVKKAEINIVAKKDRKKITLTVKVEPNKTPGNSIDGRVTSTQFYWSEKFYPTGNKTIEGTAIGEVVIYNKSNVLQPLVKTTRLLTSGDILFRLTEGVVVPANSQVAAKVYAEKAGASYDIGPSQFTIPGLRPDRQKEIYAESLKVMRGGLKKVGILTSDDIAGAQKSYKEKIKDVYLTSVSGTINGALLVRVDANAAPVASGKVGEEVSEFTLSGGNKITTVAYNTEELQKLINQALDSQLDAAMEKFLATDQEPTVNLLSVDKNTGTAELAVEQEVVVTINPNASGLTPQNFFGKHKDEIERYVLGLNHVSGVEVKFSPWWMLTVPNNPDKIKVVVKNIE